MGRDSAVHLILRSLLQGDSLDFINDLNGKNPPAKANATLLQIQMNRSATARLYIDHTFKACEVL